ncbi:unnamed protein product, partial [Discosporangium mesarthrocarpum]
MSGPPPPPRARKENNPVSVTYTDPYIEALAGAGYHVPRRLGEQDTYGDNQFAEDIDPAGGPSPSPKNILADTPETTIGPNVHMKAKLSFHRLLRVDGSFTGQLHSQGDLIVGTQGIVRGNIERMGEASYVVVDGKVVGNIEVERVRLRREAVVVGNITCKSLGMDTNVVVRGQLNVHPGAPGELVLEGEANPEDTQQTDKAGVVEEVSRAGKDSDKEREESGD